MEKLHGQEAAEKQHVRGSCCRAAAAGRPEACTGAASAGREGLGVRTGRSATSLMTFSISFGDSESIAPRCVVEQRTA